MIVNKIITNYELHREGLPLLYVDVFFSFSDNRIYLFHKSSLIKTYICKLSRLDLKEAVLNGFRDFNPEVNNLSDLFIYRRDLFEEVSNPEI